MRSDKKPAALRREGLLPAVVYGRKEKPVSVELPLKEFQKAFAEAGETTVVELSGLGENKDVMIHDVAFDSLTDTPVHVDFYALEKGQTVTVAIPFTFVGEAPAVKDKGGVLVKVMHELEVTGEPKNLPHEISIDLSKLADIHDKITVADLPLPAGIATDVDPEEVVAMADTVKEETEETPMDISQIETSVERGKKDIEEGAEGEKSA